MSSVVGVISILEGFALDEARRLWKFFETEYNSKGVQFFDYPNVTFQGGHCGYITLLEDAVFELSQQVRPFEVIIDGLGYFEVPSKVVYLKVEPTEELRHINRVVNDMLKRHCDEVFEHCLPEKWVPHVTVAMGDLTEENFQRAKRDMREYHPYYRQLLSNIHLVQQCRKTGRIKIVRSYICG